MKRPERKVNIWPLRLISVSCLLLVMLVSVSNTIYAAIGDFHGTIDTLEFDASDGYEPDIIQVSGNVYAIAYRGTGNDGFLKTVTIATDGQVADSVIDTLEFDTANGYEPDIIQVSGNVYAIAYRGTGSDGFLETVTIATDGQIADTVIDTLEFDTSSGLTPDIIHISGNVYAIAYRGSGSDGFLETVTIATDGQIADTVIDTLEFDTSTGYEPDIIPISGNVYAIAYRGTGSDGFLITVNIATDGQITDTVIDTLEFDTANGYEPDIISISGNVYAIAYRGTGSDGFMITVNIATDGQITDTVIDTMEFDTSDCYTPNIIHIVDNGYAIAYRGTDSDGFLETVNIATDGQITDTVIDTLEFDTTNGLTPNIIPVDGNVYAVAYCGESNDGYLKTVNIETIALPAVTTDNATMVEETTATLNGTLNNDGGEACEYRFEYDTDSGAPYAFSTAWTGSVTSGQTFNANINGLSKGTKYYFVAEARNSTGTISGSELNFLTKPDGPAPGSFIATASSDTAIELSWVKGEGALRTMIRRQTGSYPNSVTEGDEVYFDTGTSVTDTGLSPGTTYYYRAWSEVTGSQQWSDGYAEAYATTSSTPAPPTTVGGIIYPVNKLYLLASLFGPGLLMLLALTGTGSIIYVVKFRN